jgi:hypothetical protein
VMKVAKPRIMLNIDGICNGKYAVRPTMMPVMMATIIRVLSSDMHIPLHVFQLINARGVAVEDTNGNVLRSMFVFTYYFVTTEY